MQILDTSNKYLLSVFPRIVFEKLNKSIVKLKSVGGGSFGRVFKAELSDGTIIALKAYRLQGNQNSEAFQLELLSQNTDVDMPKVIFTYKDDKTAVMAMSFVDGKNALNPKFLFISKQQKNAFAKSVVCGMLQWHSVSGRKFGDIKNPIYDSWLDFYKNEKQQPWIMGLKKLSDNGKFSKKKLKLLIEATELFNNLPDRASIPVLIHSDLNIMNIMVDSKNMKLNAFIDPCGSLWADREYDLFQLRNMWGDAYGLYEAYKSKCKLSEYADFKVAYYGAMNEAANRLSGGIPFIIWEDLNNKRLKKEMKKLKEKM